MNKPLVSICCLVYNHAPYIRKCLDSFLMQECDFTYEVLIHDDASTDGTQEIIREYQNKYPNIIKPIFQKENIFSKGIRAINVQFNFSRARGKYIALCEGDDYWTDPHKLQKQVDYLENNPAYAATYHRASGANENGEIVINNIWKSYKSHTQEELLLGKNVMITSTILYRNIIEYPEELKNITASDLFLWHLIGFYGAGKFINSIKPSVYRTHSGGIWSLKSRVYKLENLLHTNKLIGQNLKKHNKSLKWINWQSSRAVSDFMIGSLSDRDIKGYFKGFKYLLIHSQVKIIPFLKVHFKTLASILRHKLSKEKK